MKQQLFMDMLDLAWQDFRSAEPQSAVGMAVVVIHRNKDDDMDVQMGSNVPPEIISRAFRELVKGWDRQELAFSKVYQKPHRKVV